MLYYKMVHLKWIKMNKSTYIGNVGQLIQARFIRNRNPSSEQTCLVTCRLLHNSFHCLQNKQAHRLCIPNLHTDLLSRNRGGIIERKHLYRSMSTASHIPSTQDDTPLEEIMNNDGMREAYFNRLSAEILQSAREKDVTMSKVSVQDVRSKLEFLFSHIVLGPALPQGTRLTSKDFETTFSEMQKLFTERTSLLLSENFETVVNTLSSEIPFGWKSFCKLFWNHSDILDLDPTQLKDSIKYIKTFLENVSDVLVVMSENPSILFATSKQLKARTSLLSEWFSRKKVENFLMTSSIIMLQEEAELAEKLKYLHHTVGLKEYHSYTAGLNTLKSDVKILEKLLFHIQARYTFLDRTGVLKKVKDERGRTVNNIKPLQMFLSSNAEFVKIIGEITEMDFKCFKLCYAKELEKAKEMNDDNEEE